MISRTNKLLAAIAAIAILTASAPSFAQTAPASKPTSQPFCWVPPTNNDGNVLKPYQGGWGWKCENEPIDPFKSLFIIYLVNEVL